MKVALQTDTFAVELADWWPSGDYHLLHAARKQARDSFNSLRSLNASSEEATKGIVHAEEVARLLRHNIVQAQKVEGKEAYRTSAILED